MKDIEGMWLIIKYAFVGLGSLISGFLGGLDGFIYTLLLFITVDYITGVLASIKHKELSSEVGFWGLVRKIFTLVMVGIASFVDKYVIGQGSITRDTVIFFYLSNEGISVLENLSRIGVQFPEKLKDVLLQFRKKG